MIRFLVWLAGALLITLFWHYLCLIARVRNIENTLREYGVEL